MFLCEMFLKIVISIYVCVYVVIKFLIKKKKKKKKNPTQTPSGKIIRKSNPPPPSKTPLLNRQTEVYRGIPIFSYFCCKA